MLKSLILNFERRDQLSADEHAVIKEMKIKSRRVATKQDIVREGERITESCLLISGFAARYNILADGSRQISAIHVPGDFLDLHSLLLGRMDHSVTGLTQCDVALVPHEFLLKVTETHPHLARMFWLSTLIDAAIHRRWLVTAGGLTAPGQLAHLICELYKRLEVVGLTSDHAFHFPLSQIDIADALGISTVHVNRTIKELRTQGLIRWQSGQMTILDWNRLCEIAQFDAAYLNLERRPR